MITDISVLDQFFVHTILSQELVVSRAWKEFTGRSAIDLQSSWNEVIHPKQFDEFLHVCEQVRSYKSPQQMRFQALDTNGIYHTFVSSIIPMNDGVIANSLLCKDNCLCLQDRYSLIKLIVNSLHAMVAYVDQERRYVYVNRAYEDFYQLSCEEIEGQSVEHLLGEGYEKAKIHVDKAFQGEVVSFEGEFSPPSANDSYHVRVTLVPHMDDGGQVLGCFVLGNPIEEGGIANARFEDLERFLSHWAGDPDGFAHFVGWAIGRLIPHKFPDLFLAIGASYFSLKDICSRLEFLYNLIEEKEEITVRDGEVIPIATVKITDGILCIRSSWGQWMMLLRDELDGLPYYSIRYYLETGERATGYLKAHWRSEWGRPNFTTVLAKVNSDGTPKYEEDNTFWNFRDTDDVLHGVTVYPHSDGFSDPWETKRLGNLIVQVSNLKNFDRKLT